MTLETDATNTAERAAQDLKLHNTGSAGLEVFEFWERHKDDPNLVAEMHLLKADLSNSLGADSAKILDGFSIVDSKSFDVTVSSDHSVTFKGDAQKDAETVTVDDLTHFLTQSFLQLEEQRNGQPYDDPSMHDEVSAMLSVYANGEKDAVLLDIRHKMKSDSTLGYAQAYDWKDFPLILDPIPADGTNTILDDFAKLGYSVDIVISNNDPAEFVAAQTYIDATKKNYPNLDVQIVYNPGWVSNYETGELLPDGRMAINYNYPVSVVPQVPEDSTGQNA